MAKFIPDLNKIKTSMRPKPEVGEMFLLDLLAKELSDDWYVYFQVSIDGSHPDIVLVCQNFGVIIIEVKDWYYNSYHILKENNSERWIVKSKNQRIKSPIDQVDEYRWLVKEKLVNIINVDEYDNVIRNIIGVVYFHNFTKSEINHVAIVSNKCEYYIKLLNRETCLESRFISILNNYIFHKHRKYFSEKVTENFRNLFKPSLNWMDTMLPNELFHFNKKQLELSTSKPEHIKFRGVAGSGKTFVLAKRAIDAFKKKGQKVLILFFNITITNYFHDKISVFREDISWKAFEIIHFHDLIYNKIRLFVDIDYDDDYDDINVRIQKIIEMIKSGHQIEQYSTILVDEGQDFEVEWFDFIKNYLLAPNGEYVICADEKQNVYNKVLEDNKIITNIPGRWNELNESYRLAGNIKMVVQNFQQKYFPAEDSLIEGNYKMSLFDPQIFYYRTLEYNINDDVVEVIHKMRSEGIKDSDICIITDHHSTLKSISDILKNQNINHYYVSENKQSKKGLYLNNDLIKLVSIYSFKGWESSSVVLIIEDHMKPELLYTGMTRAFTNLYIISSNYKYEDFFDAQEQIGLLTVIKKSRPLYEELPF